MTYYFALTNLKTGQLMCYLTKIKPSDIELAMQLANVGPENIGIEIREIGVEI